MKEAIVVKALTKDEGREREREMEQSPYLKHQKGESDCQGG